MNNKSRRFDPGSILTTRQYVKLAIRKGEYSDEVLEEAFGITAKQLAKLRAEVASEDAPGARRRKKDKR